MFARTDNVFSTISKVCYGTVALIYVFFRSLQLNKIRIEDGRREAYKREIYIFV